MKIMEEPGTTKQDLRPPGKVTRAEEKASGEKGSEQASLRTGSGGIEDLPEGEQGLDHQKFVAKMDFPTFAT